jgi:hypothetical protein
MWRRLFVLGLVASCLTAFALPADAAIRIRRIAFDPPGEDGLPEPNSDLNKELVRICNTANRGKSIRRWRLRDQGADPHLPVSSKVPSPW